MVSLKWTPAKSRTAGVVTAGMLVAVAECGLGSPGPVSVQRRPASGGHPRDNDRHLQHGHHVHLAEAGLKLVRTP
jgi:hypothetical protein